MLRCRLRKDLRRRTRRQGKWEKRRAERAARRTTTATKGATRDTATSIANVVLGDAYELYDDGRSSTTTWKTAAKTDEIGDGAALLAGAAGVGYDY